MRGFPQNFVERDSKRGNWTVRRSRAGRVPLLQRVGFPDTLIPPARRGRGEGGRYSGAFMLSTMEMALSLRLMRRLTAAPKSSVSARA